MKVRGIYSYHLSDILYEMWVQIWNGSSSLQKCIWIFYITCIIEVSEFSSHTTDELVQNFPENHCTSQDKITAGIVNESVLFFMFAAQLMSTALPFNFVIK